METEKVQRLMDMKTKHFISMITILFGTVAIACFFLNENIRHTLSFYLFCVLTLLALEDIGFYFFIRKYCHYKNAVIKLRQSFMLLASLTGLWINIYHLFSTAVTFSIVLALFIAQYIFSMKEKPTIYIKKSDLSAIANAKIIGNELIFYILIMLTILLLIFFPRNAQLEATTLFLFYTCFLILIGNGIFSNDAIKFISTIKKSHISIYFFTALLFGVAFAVFFYNLDTLYLLIASVTCCIPNYLKNKKR